MANFVINAGHAPNGKPDPGAVGQTGLRECDVTLDVANEAAQFLRAVGHGAKVVQSDDLDEVCAAADGADFFVSVHCNAAGATSARGMEIFTSRGVTRADKLATFIMNQMAGDFPKLPVRADWSDGDVDKEAGLYVLIHTDCPAVLVELAFISNLEDEKILASAKGKTMFAAAIARGCTDMVAAGA